MGRIAPLIVVLLAVPIGMTQVDPMAGAIPASTGVGSAYDRLDVASSNILVTVPVRDKSGKIPFSFKLVSNSHAYIYTAPNNQKYWEVNSGFLGQPFSADLGARFTYTATPSTCNTQADTTFSNFAVIDPTGASHGVDGMLLDVDGCSLTQATGVTRDGTGYTLSVSTSTFVPNISGSIYDRSGNRATFSTNRTVGIVKVTDPDGAFIEADRTKQGLDFITTYTDTLGQIALTYDEQNRTYTYNDAGGNPQAFTVTNSQYYQKTVFNCQGISDIDSGGVNQSFPTSISTPVGVISIGYEQTPGFDNTHTTGRIVQLTLPSGGSISYAYAGGNNGVNCTSQVVPTLTRTVNDNNGNSIISTYVNSNASSTENNFTVTVDFPYTHGDSKNSTTVYNFGGEFQTQAAYYQGAATGTPLKIVQTCWDNNHICSPLPTLPVIKQHVQTNFNSSNAQAGNRVIISYDCANVSPCYGVLTQVEKDDWGLALVSTENLSYTGCGVSSSLYIFDKPCSDTVLDANNNQIRQTTFAYSSTGHPTSVSRSVTGSSSLTSSAAYGTNGAAAGVLSSATDVNQATTSATNFVCNGILATTINYPLSLSSSQTWDSNCQGAALQSLTDANLNPTTYTHSDPLWRMTSATDQNYPAMNLSYPDATHFEDYMNFNGSVSTVDTTTATDGLGRPILVQKRQGQGSSSFDSVQYQYGSNSTGAFMKQSLPYSVSPVAWTTRQYDVLGRRQAVTDGGGGTITYSYLGQSDVLVTVASPSSSKQLEYDGVGRLISVCEITAGTTAWPKGPCGQKTAANGYLTKYTYDTTTLNSNVVTRVTVQQNAQSTSLQTRVYLYDLLGRMVKETNPESGTTQYFYDTAPSSPGVACTGTYNGDLVKKYDAQGNTICYTYDALHRVTQVSYPAGPNSAATPTKHFVYDATTFSCPATNVKGRLAEAYTGSSSSKITDRAYCYSARGEVTDIFSSTQNSNGTYHITKTYWPHGAVASLSGLPGVPTIYYGASDGSGLDGEGRITKVKVPSGSGQNPVTGAIYNTTNTLQPIGALTQVTYGSGDVDQFGYDLNTGRMTGYQYNVGITGQSPVVGTLTWNQNGTLQRLSIVDHFDSANQQTCTYGYDDLARVNSVGCGSTWAQTFGFDPFGNITKSGSISWMPGYSTSTNRYTLAGTTYDNNGNLTADTFHTYQWDAEGRAVAIPGGAQTQNPTTQSYDALGNLAEITYTALGLTFQQLHDENGRALGGAANAQGSNPDAFIPLPGGGTANYYGGSLKQYWHPDWLGSSRFSSTPTQTMYEDKAYAPYGESYAGGGNSQYWLPFAGLIEQMENDDYHTLFRELNTTQGRWIQPDPAGLAAVDPSNPQTWNRYAYVNNNPLSSVDPTGLLDDPSCKVNDIGCGGMDSGGMGGWDFGGGGGRGGAGMEGCGVDIFCIQNGGMGPFGSPVAHLVPDGKGGVTTGSWVTSTYTIGGDFISTTQAANGTVNINCVGTSTSAECSLAGYTNWLVSNDGSHRINPMYPGLGPGDQPVGINIWQGNAALWRNASGAANTAYMATGLVLVSPFAGPAAGALNTATIEGAAYLETVGIPVTAGAAWTINNWRTIDNWRKAFTWIWNQF